MGGKGPFAEGRKLVAVDSGLLLYGGDNLLLVAVFGYFLEEGVVDLIPSYLA